MSSSMRKALVPVHLGGSSVARLRLGPLLCILLMGGCACIGRAPQPEAPPVAVAPAAAIVSNEPQAAPAAPRAEPVPTRPPIAPPATVERGTVMTAPVVQPAERAASGATGQSAAKPAASEPKAPAKAAAPPVRATPPAPAAPPVPAVPPAPAAQAPKAPTPTAAATKPEAPPPLDLKSLETRLKETKAIGVFTKLALKNQIDELLDRFRAYYQGRLKTSLAELRRAFDMLVLKTLALLQDADPPLAGAIASSRESIWGILSDTAKFPKD
jgi:hypothetical protein